MIFRRLGQIFIMSLLLWQASAFAMLELELTQGVDKALPIAILPFTGQPEGSDADNMTSVIRTDLRNSGRFQVLSDDVFPEHPMSFASVNSSLWKRNKIEGIVIGRIQGNSSGYDVNFQLVDVYSNKILASQEYHVQQNQFRALAHHISDIIYQQLTGERGVFSTRITYVLVQQWPDRPRQYTLEVADSDGFNPKPLLISSHPIMSPAWSPDGKSMAYVSFENNHAAIYVVDIITGNRRLISEYPGINGAPAWSPDGSQLALVLTKTDQPKIFVLDINTHQLTQVTDGWSIDTEPNWAPDGQSIIFTSDRGGSPQIYRVSVNNHHVQRITFSGNYNARASFTPDGKSIVMLHREDKLFNIAVQDLQTGRVTELTRSGLDDSPSLAPNGGMVLYGTQYGDRAVLGVVSTDGRVKLRLPAREGEVQEPAWSPFLS